MDAGHSQIRSRVIVPSAARRSRAIKSQSPPDSQISVSSSEIRATRSQSPPDSQISVPSAARKSRDTKISQIGVPSAAVERGRRSSSSSTIFNSNYHQLYKNTLR